MLRMIFSLAMTLQLIFFSCNASFISSYPNIGTYSQSPDVSTTHYPLYTFDGIEHNRKSKMIYLTATESLNIPSHYLSPTANINILVVPVLKGGECVCSLIDTFLN